MERRRIEAAGGKVMFNRVNGDLAVSRAFGDFQFKNASLPSSKQQVIVDPDVTILERFKDDSFVIIACDGIWDVMSTRNANEFVAARLQGGYSISDTCEALVDYCLQHGSRDNMSVLLVCFKSTSQDVA